MTSVAFVNYKGGVAKTESVYRSGIYYAKRRLKPLLIDIDPQANLTRRCKGFTVRNIGHVLGGAAPATANIAGVAQNIDLGEMAYLVASDITLENVAVGLLQRNFNRLTALSNALRDTGPALTGLTLIDTPPNAGILTLNALVAADYVVICAEPEEDAIAGAQIIRQIIGEVDGERGRAPKILGTIATKVDESLVRHQEGMKRLEADGMPPVLGIVPKRAGRDADAKLDEAYAPIAEYIWQRLGD